MNENDVESNNDIVEEIDDSDCLCVESANEENMDNKIKVSRNEWCNTELIPKEVIKCFVPKSLFDAIMSIEKSVNKKFTASNEFSIYIHGDFNSDGDIVVSEEYYIPKQVVGPATVEYLEEPATFYNGCLHKHPNGCKSFSGTDKTYINSNFEFSLLYVDKKIHMGIVNIKYFGNKRLQTKLQICVDEDELPDINVENITKMEIKPVIPTVNNTNSPLLPGFNSDDEKDKIPLPSFMRDAESIEDPDYSPGWFL